MTTRRPPIGLPVPALVAMLLLALPLLGLVVRAPWSNLFAELQPATASIRLSFVVSITATMLAMVLGIPLAWLLARGSFRAKTALRAIVVLPIVVPPVVGGVALLTAFGRNGLVGRWIDALVGLRLPFSIAGAVLAATFVSLPFVVLTVEAGLRSMDRRYEEAAETLGAGAWRVFTRVTLPLIRPALAAATLLGWARAVGEFGATITFAGNVPGRTQTIPLAIFLQLENRPSGAIALSLVVVAMSIGLLLLLRDVWFR